MSAPQILRPFTRPDATARASRVGDMKHLEDGWKQSIELDEHPPIEVGQTNPASALTAQHEQLVPQDRILGLKPRVRSTR